MSTFVKRPAFWIVLLVVLAAGRSSPTACSRRASPPSRRPPSSRSARSAAAGDRRARRVGRFEVWREYSGDVGGVREAVVRARSEDQIAAVLVTVGQR
jgi:hypothetical protein